MMIRRLTFVPAAALAGAGMLFTASTSQASVVIETFDNYTSGGNVAAWADFANTFTAGATEWTIDVNNGGYGFHFDDTGNPPNGIDISGNDTLEIDVRVNSGGAFGTTVIAVLEDINALQWVYDFGAQQGNLAAGFDGTISAPLNLPPGFDATAVTFFHVQGNSFDDPYPTPYSLTFKEMRATPEPASMALLGCGLGLAALRRR